MLQGKLSSHFQNDLYKSNLYYALGNKKEKEKEINNYTSFELYRPDTFNILILGEFCGALELH